MSISWDLPPRWGGELSIFLASASPMGRRSRPFSTLLLPEGEALRPFLNTFPPRRGGGHAVFQHFSSLLPFQRSNWSIWW